jgi:hypothetical protein
MFEVGDYIRRTGTGSHHGLKSGAVVQISKCCGINKNYVSIRGFGDNLFHVANFVLVNHDPIANKTFGELTHEERAVLINSAINGDSIDVYNAYYGWMTYNVFDEQGNMDGFRQWSHYRVTSKEEAERRDNRIREIESEIESMTQRRKLLLEEKSFITKK